MDAHWRFKEITWLEPKLACTCLSPNPGIAMKPLQLFDPASSTYSYVLFDATTREALIIDPVDCQLERDLALLREYGLKLVWTVETHAHADHITSAGQLVEHTGARSAAPEGCGIATAASQLGDGDALQFGGEQVRVLHTPGHTAGSVSYLWRDHVFTGDTLLVNGCGRTDFQSGNAEALYQSITRRLFVLPESTTVWPGHDYQGRTHSTIGAEKAGNARVAGKSLAGFVSAMTQLHLPRPARMDEALPANQNSGLGVGRQDADGATLMLVQPKDGYAGDVSAELASRWWQSGEAVLVDVRTDAEREWVGFVPGAVALAWKQWPGMAMNPQFDEGLKAAVPAGGKAVMLCRSGVRSVAAAKRATELGIEAYNILEGFEGDPDAEAHRGARGGLRYRGLPWRQN
jgi:glyoxylase-like metal-dependent hydrolase (beta-lactamase superfamily II)/rhodanese-related sulfurtransferase